MPLNTTGLVQNIRNSFLKQQRSAGKKPSQQSIDELSKDLADAIEIFVKSGDVETNVNTPAGIGVQVTPLSGTGTTTTIGKGKGTGKIK